MLLNVTATGLHRQQAALDSALQTIRSEFNPQQTALVTTVDQDTYRFVMYYLPEYIVLRLDPANANVMMATGLHEGNWVPISDCLMRGATHAVWVVSPPVEPGSVPQEATRVSSAEDGPFQVWDVELSPSTPDYRGFKLGGPCFAG
jgi:hypothetical protein